MTTRDDASKSRSMEKPRSEAANKRLAAALRENLKRRKAQARGRDVPASDLKSGPKSDQDPSS